ncbi:ABC-ATPase domain-containing protein [Paenibacillus sp. SYP-B4298]|uniref:ABC-ATPase domain-containing protein n=1 Tax=Paenibacillus sp. SYP-B4298 TaxID=2996034 RepID=UPI0022DDE7B9|nr:ABC-ATPase domain-containing protein [Paenibacillus sp. SYP-B4298]
MKQAEDLQKLLQSIEGKGYPAYKALKGSYDCGAYILAIDHVQADPYAPPSKARVLLKRQTAGIPKSCLDSRAKVVAVSDFLARAFGRAIQKAQAGGQGAGNNGQIIIDSCGQEILERTAIVIGEERMEARLEIGLPAAGRRVLGKAADRLLREVLPKVVEQALLYRNLDQQALDRHIASMLDQEHIRQELRKRRLVAFVANGSMLPRESGVSDRPMRGGIPFQSPVSLETTMELPSGRTVTGMGIAEGITLIVGGGYHGKSTLLQALQRGVYNHIPGDGREGAITREDAVKIRAEDGRPIERVDISPFINNLPGKKDTRQFSTENASGSTSQAANVMEALEAGASLLLIDEDTSATNFMIRDRRMQRLIASDKEPITPFLDKIRPLYEEHGVSTILIVGGTGDYFDTADRVIMLDEYVPRDVTEQAKDIAASDTYRRDMPPEQRFGGIMPRIPMRFGPPTSGRDDRIRAKSLSVILYGKQMIDLSALEQLVDDSQTRAIAVMLDYYKQKLLGKQWTLAEAADWLYEQIDRDGLASLSSHAGHPGDLARPRKQEFCAALNRYRGLQAAVADSARKRL